jgi:CIC family chloride channel protein
MVGREEPPLELQLVGRTIMHAILVGITVGLAGCLLLLGLEAAEHLVLGAGMAYPHLVAVGEGGAHTPAGPARLWLVAFAPAIGGVVAGLIARWAPEVAGGGGDAMIDAFHHHGGTVRPRVILLKPMASIATLGCGGAGGREGPTMQLGAAIGSLIASALPASPRERRILMISGVAAGVAAVFRTPLGAALLAIEVLYQDDFESEALIPAVLASVVAYSLSATLLSTAPMFGVLPRFPFQWEHLPLYALSTLVVASAAVGFVALLRRVQALSRVLPGPLWARPAVGGLALGLLAVVALVVVPDLVDVPPSFASILGGGYGAGQLAILGSDSLGLGLTAGGVLLGMAVLRGLATALTIGSGGSAGDFAPALGMGALVGGAFGQMASVWVPSVTPGAFALVGMAVFYGGAAKTPLAATIIICEMAGSYDLLVPLMLSQAIAFVALRRTSLYPAQKSSVRASPVHASTWQRHARVSVPAGALVAREQRLAVLREADPADVVVRVMADNPEQPVFPVVGVAGELLGLVTVPIAHDLIGIADPQVAIAADLMEPPVSVAVTTPLTEVARLLVERRLRAIPVVDNGCVIGLVDEHDVSRAYLVVDSVAGAEAV